MGLVAIRSVWSDLKIIYIVLCVRVFCLHARVCVLCMPGAHRALKRIPDSFELTGVTDSCELPGGC